VTAFYLGDGNFLGSSNSLAQVVNIVAQRPSALGVQHNGDGTVTIVFAGAAGQEYVVQASSDLSSPAWENVATNRASEDGHWTFTESTADRLIRWYRAMTP
jgi:hypothetical protein